MTAETVLVTGATRGIGRATVRALDDRGFRVYAGYRDDADAEQLDATTSDRVRPVRLDVTDPASIDAAVRRIETDGAALRGIVNNAGIVVPGPLEALPLDDLRHQFEVNLFGLVALTQACLPLLRAAGGRIVMISSLNGRVAVPWTGPYCASKHALEAVSDSWRVELSRWGIHVAVIQPGAIQSDIWTTSRDRGVRISGKFSAGDQDRYAGIIRRIGDASQPRHAIPPGRVARRIVHALTARRPRTRYVVGLDARMAVLLKTLLPTRLFDRLLGARGRTSGR